MIFWSCKFGIAAQTNQVIFINKTQLFAEVIRTVRAAVCEGLGIGKSVELVFVLFTFPDQQAKGCLRLAALQEMDCYQLGQEGHMHMCITCNFPELQLPTVLSPAHCRSSQPAVLCNQLTHPILAINIVPYPHYERIHTNRNLKI